MSDTPKLLLAALALVVLASALAAAAWLVWGPPWGEMQLWIDGRRVEMPPMHVGHWLVAAAVLVALFALAAVLLPVVLLLAVGLPMLVAGVVLAVVLSPLWIVVLLVWWLLRRDRRAVAAPPPAAP